MPSWYTTSTVLAASIPPVSQGDEPERSLVFILAAVILGLIVVLLVLLQVSAIRGRSIARRKAALRHQTETRVDPWAEAGRRAEPLDGDEDQS
ncbi:MAG: hypothetical protein CMJ36_00185 [Phycisphaerae bacterium]|nr:hypothetical protein [Phycisphaerae bacterium]